MALIEEALFEFLNADATLTALLGDRIFPQEQHQGSAAPSIVYEKINGPREYAHDGPSGLATPIIRFSCWGKNTLEAKTVADELRKVLSGFSGMMGATSMVKVQGAMIINERDLQDPATDLKRVIVDYRVPHEET